MGNCQSRTLMQKLGRLSGTVPVLVLLGLLLPLATANAADMPSVAFYYGSDVPTDMLDQFDWAVVEPDNMAAGQLAALQRYGTTAFAYVSLGEADRWRNDAAVPQSAIVSENKQWNSDVIDLTDPAWGNYIVEQRIRPLWKQGYRAVFLDTLDSYRLFAKTDAQATAEQKALVALIKRIHDTFPGIKLLLNRGFEVLDQVHSDVVGVAAESLFQSWDAGRSTYGQVNAADRQYLLNKLLAVKNQYGLPAIAIDYVAPKDRALARTTAKKIAAKGLIPWVTDGALDQVGVGAIEPMPRKVLLIYDKSRAESGLFAYTDAHTYGAMPLEYLGYGTVYQDVNAPLPSGTLKGRYAGIVTWLDGPVADASTYRDWLLKQMDDGVRVAMLGNTGIPISGALADRMGLQAVSSGNGEALSIVRKDDLLGFEGMPPKPPQNEEGYTSQADGNKLHLLMRDAKGTEFAPVVTGHWGGVALSPWLFQTSLPGHNRWLLNPFKFFKIALDLPTLPIADATTENGSRYWMTQVDGDAFVSRSNFPGSPFASEVMLNRIFKRFKVPTTVSVVEGEIGQAGLYPKLSPQMEAIARNIFKLPWVEIATHTFSHPFNWEGLKEGDLSGEGKTAAGYGYNLPIPGYRYSTRREVIGSTHYINSRLAPPGKHVKTILWSGDALPPEKAVTMADDIGLANLNGGNTSETTDNPSITDVTPMLRPFSDNTIQVYAPIINEDVYTDNFKAPLWGFRRVIETFKLTNEPRRLKPIDIYYHFYSATVPASLKAVVDVYHYAQAQQTLPLYASQYSAVARNWYNMGIARTLSGHWQITGATDMRTLRLPRGMGWPDMAHSQGVVGVRDIKPGRYVALSGAPRVSLALQTSKPAMPYLSRSNGRVDSWAVDGDQYTLKMHSIVVPLQLVLNNIGGCQVKAPGARRSTHGATTSLRYSGTQSGGIRIHCDR